MIRGGGLAEIRSVLACLLPIKSGADFPAYIKEISQLGVTSYEAFVSDGHNEYMGDDDYKIVSPAKYTAAVINDQSNKEQFQSRLKAHQQGKTDYPTFCKDCAESGIDKWVVDIRKMSCTYYDKNANEMLVEQIPQ